MSNTQAIDEFDFMAEGDEQSTIGLPKLNFGKCTISSKFIKWENKEPTEVTPTQFAKLNPKARSQEVTVSIDIQEFNPNLQFTYSRRVNVGGIDWNKILKPSLFKAFGVKPVEGEKGTQAKQVASMMRQLNGAYVCVEDVPQSLTKKDREAGLTEGKYNTVKVVQVYGSRVECYEHWKSTYGRATNGGAPMAEEGPSFASGIPEGYTAQAWAGEKESLLEKYNAHYKTIKAGTDTVKRAKALTHVAENEAGSSVEQLVELIGV